MSKIVRIKSRILSGTTSVCNYTQKATSTTGSILDCLVKTTLLICKLHCLHIPAKRNRIIPLGY
nr:MAG TPA: hypothetical protein [Caudoviricetes sp.]